MAEGRKAAEDLSLSSMEKERAYKDEIESMKKKAKEMEEVVRRFEEREVALAEVLEGRGVGRGGGEGAEGGVEGKVMRLVKQIEELDKEMEKSASREESLKEEINSISGRFVAIALEKRTAVDNAVMLRGWLGEAREEVQGLQEALDAMAKLIKKIIEEEKVMSAFTVRIQQEKEMVIEMGQQFAHERDEFEKEKDEMTVELLGVSEELKEQVELYESTSKELKRVRRLWDAEKQDMAQRAESLAGEKGGLEGQLERATAQWSQASTSLRDAQETIAESQQALKSGKKREESLQQEVLELESEKGNLEEALEFEKQRVKRLLASSAQAEKSHAALQKVRVPHDKNRQPHQFTAPKFFLEQYKIR